MSETSMSNTAFDVSQRLATAGGFLLALGGMVADREIRGDGESRTMKKASMMVSNIECAVSFIENQQREIGQLMEANHRCEEVIAQQKALIEEWKAKIRAYCADEQEIPGR